jgi:hypothetical protein
MCSLFCAFDRSLNISEQSIKGSSGDTPHLSPKTHACSRSSHRYADIELVVMVGEFFEHRYK